MAGEIGSSYGSAYGYAPGHVNSASAAMNFPTRSSNEYSQGPQAAPRFTRGGGVGTASVEAGSAMGGGRHGASATTAIDMSGGLDGTRRAYGTPPTATHASSLLQQQIDRHRSTLPLRSLLQGYFKPYMDSSNEGRFNDLINERFRHLSAMGHDVNRIRQNMAKANHFDWATAAATGAVNATPFAWASLALDLSNAPVVAGDLPAAQGALVGGVAGVTDVAGMRVLESGTQNARWLHTDPRNLEPVMQEALAARNTQMSTAQNAALLQPYSARNVVRTMAAPMAQHLGGKPAADLTDTVIASGGGLVAGAGMGMLSRYFNQVNGSDSEAMLLAHKDWRNLYESLDQRTWNDQIDSGIDRVGRFPGDLATGLSNMAQRVASPAGLAEIGTLAGGFAGISWIKNAASAAATQAGYSPEMTRFVEQGVNTLASIPVYAGLPNAMGTATHYANAAAQYLQQGGWTNTPAVTAAAQPQANLQPAVPGTPVLTQPQASNLPSPSPMANPQGADDASAPLIVNAPASSMV
jgi:hypothetical protein